MAKQPELVVGLDVGSYVTRLAVCALEKDCIRYLAHAETPSRGWHKGMIADQAAVTECIRTVLAEVQTGGLVVEAAVLGMGGPTVRAVRGRGVYDFGHPRPIEPRDRVEAIHIAVRNTPLGGDDVLQVLPQDFTVDGRAPTRDPLHLECRRLEAHVLILAVSHDYHEALVNAAQRASLKVEETIFEAMAAEYSAVLPEERALGVAVLDIGGHSSNLLYYDGDSMVYAAGMPHCGELFTNDLIALRSLSFEEAERLKLRHGCALLGLSSHSVEFEFPAEQQRPARRISRRELILILQARANQLLELVEVRRRRHAPELSLREGLVLSGGGSLLDGLVVLAERTLRGNARLAIPTGIAGWPKQLRSPAWATAAGLAMYSARLRRYQRDAGEGPSLKQMFTG